MIAFIVIISLLVIGAIVWKVTGHSLTALVQPLSWVFNKMPILLQGKNRQSKSTDSASGQIERAIKLRSGGAVSISCDKNILTASTEDRKFLNDILDMLQDYEEGGEKK